MLAPYGGKMVAKCWQNLVALYKRAVPRHRVALGAKQYSGKMSAK